MGNLKDLRYQQSLNLDARDHVAELHPNRSATISFIDDGLWTELNSKLPNDLIETCSFLEGEPDVYISQNSILPFKPRCYANIGSLGSFWVDLDCYSVNMTQAEALAKAEQIITRYNLPTPRIEAQSGRGLYLIWTMAIPVNVSSKIKNRDDRLAWWRGIMANTIELFKECGADPKASDPARVLRLSGTINSKNGAIVSYSISGNKLKSFNELGNPVKAALIQIKPKKKPKFKSLVPVKRSKANTSKPKASTKSIKSGALGHVFTRYGLASARMFDVRELARLRGGRFTDHRAMAIYIYAVEAAWWCRTRETLLNELGDFIATSIQASSKYDYTRPERHINAVLQRVTDVSASFATEEGDNRYKQSNTFIINTLEITEKEQRKLRATICGDEKQRRDTAAISRKRRSQGVVERADYDKKRTNKLEQRKQMALDLRVDGLSIRAIAEKVGVSKSSVHSYLS